MNVNRIMLAFAMALAARGDTIAFWHFEEGPASAPASGAGTILDASGNGLNGTAFGEPFYVADGTWVPGSVLGLSFHDARIAVPDSPVLAQLFNSLTLDAWVRMDGLPTATGQIVFRGDDRGTVAGFYLSVNGSGDLVFHVGDGSGNASDIVSPGPLPVGVFLRVMGSLDVNSGTQALWVNGIQVASQNTPVRAAGQLVPAQNPGVGIGSTQSAKFPQFFNGLIDEVNIRNDAAVPWQASGVGVGIQIGSALPMGTLPVGMVESYYSQTLMAAGGTAPLAWSVLLGELPPGLSMDAAGDITGIPSVAGTYNFTIGVSDGAATSAASAFRIVIISPLTITTSAVLMAGAVNATYSGELDASLGRPPYQWSLVSGVLPLGMTMSETGELSGTPVAAGTYNFTALVTDETSATVAKTFSLMIAPDASSAGAVTITTGGVVPLYGTVSTIQPGEWVSIYGTNLAVAAASWTGDFPVMLGGTSVTINGTPAYLAYVSPEQINLQAPDDTAIGMVPVVVTTAAGSTMAMVNLAAVAPSFIVLDTVHAAGIITRTDGSGAYGGGSYDMLGPTGTSLGYATVAAKAGDYVTLFGTGFGPTSPLATSGQPFSDAAAVTDMFTLTINGVVVTPSFVGLTGAGLDQVNFTVPAGLGTGDAPVVLTIGGSSTQLGVMVPLE